MTDPSRFPGEQLRVRLGDIQLLDPILSRHAIASSPQLQDLAIFRQPQGTNFLVSPAQDAAIVELIEGRLFPPKPPAPRPRTLTLDWLEAQTLWPKSKLEEIVDALITRSPQVVLAGPPGTGKTWLAKHIATYVTDGRAAAVRTVQFHPSYTYEQFIEGLRPVVKKGAVKFKRVNGIVLDIAKHMVPASGPYVLIIDEMNRANLPKVFGELMYLFEYRDEEIDLQHSRRFALPSALRFLATMNTADRSIRSIDIALRRRFDVFECPPDADILRRYYVLHENHVPDLIDGFEKLNLLLSQRLDRHHTIGHAFFMQNPLTPAGLLHAWERKIRPLIEEYFFDQPDVAAIFNAADLWPSLHA